MQLLHADHVTQYQVPGVPGLVRKPVNLDGADLGFQRLRSLRLYEFQAGTVIDGHAEQDEVFVIVSAGSVEMQIGFNDQVVDGFGTFTLVAPQDSAASGAFVAYLPPGSVYRMTPHTDADVFYARATPSEARQPAVFGVNASSSAAATHVLFQDRTHAVRLRLTVVRLHPEHSQMSLRLLDQAEASCEALVYVERTPAARIGTLPTTAAEPLEVQSSDTVAISPGDDPVLQVEHGSSVTVITVFAC